MHDLDLNPFKKQYLRALDGLINELASLLRNSDTAPLPAALALPASGVLPGSGLLTNGTAGTAGFSFLSS